MDLFPLEKIGYLSTSNKWMGVSEEMPVSFALLHVYWRKKSFGHIFFVQFLELTACNDKHEASTYFRD